MFRLHEKLALDTIQVEDWELCRVRLMNDSRFPWLILVPRRADLRDFDQVSARDRQMFLTEITWATRALREVGQADKMNVASLGNEVPQLHVHVIARRQTDPAWPKPVWGVGSPEPYSEHDAEVLVRRIKLDVRTVRTSV